MKDFDILGILGGIEDGTGQGSDREEIGNKPVASVRSKLRG